jgi:hypothetical protein
MEQTKTIAGDCIVHAGAMIRDPRGQSSANRRYDEVRPDPERAFPRAEIAEQLRTTCVHLRDVPYPAWLNPPSLTPVAMALIVPLTRAVRPYSAVQ